MGFAIGVDVGGTKIAAGVVSDDGEVVAFRREPTPEDMAGLQEAMASIIVELHHEHPVSSVGVAIAGFVSTDRSTVVSAPNLALSHAPVGKLLGEMTGLRVIVENDANAAAWGEHRFGSGVGSSDLLCVTIGTGVGGGVVVAGELVRGHWGFAAEVGHIPLVPDGRSCPCGSRGCWEQYGSGTALVRIARELAATNRSEADFLLGLGDGTPDGIEGDHVTLAAQKGDRVALAAFEQAGAWNGRGLAVLARVLDPAVFVIGGGVSEAGELILDPMRRTFAAMQPDGMGNATADVRAARLGNDAGLIGAADLARRSG